MENGIRIGDLVLCDGVDKGYIVTIDTNDRSIPYFVEMVSERPGYNGSDPKDLTNSLSTSALRTWSPKGLNRYKWMSPTTVKKIECDDLPIAPSPTLTSFKIGDVVKRNDGVGIVIHISDDDCYLLERINGTFGSSRNAFSNPENVKILSNYKSKYHDRYIWVSPGRIKKIEPKFNRGDELGIHGHSGTFIVADFQYNESGIWSYRGTDGIWRSSPSLELRNKSSEDKGKRGQRSLYMLNGEIYPVFILGFHTGAYLVEFYERPNTRTINCFSKREITSEAGLRLMDNWMPLGSNYYTWAQEDKVTPSVEKRTRKGMYKVGDIVVHKDKLACIAYVYDDSVKPLYVVELIEEAKDGIIKANFPLAHSYVPRFLNKYREVYEGDYICGTVAPETRNRDVSSNSYKVPDKKGNKVRLVGLERKPIVTQPTLQSIVRLVKPVKKPHLLTVKMYHQ